VWGGGYNYEVVFTTGTLNKPKISVPPMTLTWDCS